MLAYVFWHWKQALVLPADYERRQRAFHEALAAHPSPGFRRSRSYAVADLPWAAAGHGAYEDWYEIDNSAALDPLNDAAVSAGRAAAHDAAAAVAEGGIAGLYRLKLGEAGPPVEHAWWFGKPAGLGYEAFWSLLGPIVATPGTGLWMRQMTLGPSPEFCLQAPAPVALPRPIDARHVTLRTVFP